MGPCSRRSTQKGVATPSTTRQVVAYLQEFIVFSHRRACLVLGVDGNMVRFASRWPDDNTTREPICEMGSQRAGSAIGGYIRWYAGKDGPSATRSCSALS